MFCVGLLTVGVGVLLTLLPALGTLSSFWAVLSSLDVGLCVGLIVSSCAVFG